MAHNVCLCVCDQMRLVSLTVKPLTTNRGHKLNDVPPFSLPISFLSPQNTMSFSITIIDSGINWHTVMKVPLGPF